MGERWREEKKIVPAMKARIAVMHLTDCRSWLALGCPLMPRAAKTVLPGRVVSDWNGLRGSVG